MPEKFRKFRSRKETRKGVGKYVFEQDRIEIPDDERQLLEKMVRFAEVHEEMERIKVFNAERKKGAPKREVPADLIAERQQLQAELDPFLLEQLVSVPKSILVDSANVSRRPHAQGKDSAVYYKGTTQEFLAAPRVPRYVIKYSGSGHPNVVEENVLYFRKKYALLKSLLGPHIPRAWFVYGEFRHGLPKHKLGAFHVEPRAITIQREVRGKTFAEMTQEERARPEVQAALDIAITSYLNAREILRKACREKRKNPKSFELSLDLGDASPDTREENFNPLTYSSPNAMFDENTQTVMFIDMGWGEWDDAKDEIFEHIMSTVDLPNAA